jgi:hypothetical protein
LTISIGVAKRLTQIEFPVVVRVRKRFCLIQEKLACVPRAVPVCVVVRLFAAHHGHNRHEAITRVCEPSTIANSRWLVRGHERFHIKRLAARRAIQKQDWLVGFI